MPEDDHLRLTDPDMFWPDELIGDQFLTTEQCAVHREQMGIQWLKKMSQCLHDLERSDWCNLLT
jgi:hypothetical protein